MVVAAPIVLMLVTRDAVVESDFAGKAASGEEFQSAINGRDADLRVRLFYQAVQFIDGQMLVSFKKCPQDGAALPGLLQADPLQMPVEDFLSLADVLPRDGQMIVNSLL